jgi:hypothetical protein
MSEARPEVIQKLVQAAIQGMLHVEGVPECSADEVMSAYFTMVRRGILLTLQVSPTHKTREALRQSVMMILLDCADPTGN